MAAAFPYRGVPGGMPPGVPPPAPVPDYMTEEKLQEKGEFLGCVCVPYRILFHSCVLLTLVHSSTFF